MQGNSFQEPVFLFEVFVHSIGVFLQSRAKYGIILSKRLRNNVLAAAPCRRSPCIKYWHYGFISSVSELNNRSLVAHHAFQVINCDHHLQLYLVIKNRGIVLISFAVNPSFNLAIACYTKHQSSYVPLKANHKMIPKTNNLILVFSSLVFSTLFSSLPLNYPS